ncbi:PqqD family protein [soil metagenome]
MNLSDRFRLNEKSIAYEMFDGEVLAVNLETGTYYSLPEVGANIWSCLLSGMSIGQTAQALSEIYDAQLTDLEKETSNFVSKMCGENLIISADQSGQVPPVQPVRSSVRKTFNLPEMSIYNDMQDLLLLDPIHEVDEAGWPVLRPGGNQVAEN